MSEDYISWEAVLREDFRKTIHSIFLLLSDLEIFHPVKGVRIKDGHADAGRMHIRKMRRYYSAMSTYVGYFGYSHRCELPKISAWPSLARICEF